MKYPAHTAAASGLALCHTCLRLDDAAKTECSTCGSPLHIRNEHSLQTTIALLLTAAILYIPANLLPIMDTFQLGTVEESTILGGVILLINLNSIPIALVIFVASIVVPLAKMCILWYLVWSVSRHSEVSPKQRTVAYRLTEFVGRWSMVDVFVVAVLVGLVQLQGLLVIKAGPATLAFAGVVVVTMLAAHSFDTRLIWDQIDNPETSVDG